MWHYHLFVTTHDPRSMRQAEAMRQIIQDRLNAEFPDGLNEAAGLIGIPKSSFYRYFGNDPAPVDGIPGTIMIQTLNWLADNRGYPGYGQTWDAVAAALE